MCVVLIGGITRLEQQYQKEAARCGMDLRIFSAPTKCIGTKLKNADAVVIFTNMVSHNAKRDAVKAARTNNIPVFMHHTCGVCTLRECLNCLDIINMGKP